MDKELRRLRDVDLIERQRKSVTDKSLLIYEDKANRDAGFKMFTPELKRITHLITKARSESNFKFWNCGSLGKRLIFRSIFVHLGFLYDLGLNFVEK